MDALFEIECHAPAYGTDTAYADDAESAFVAYWQLRKDAATMGTRSVIRNLETGLVVWDERWS